MILLFKEASLPDFYYKSLQLQSAELLQLRYVFAILLVLTIVLAILSKKKKKQPFWLILTIATALSTTSVLVYSLTFYREHYLMQQKYGIDLFKRYRLDKYQVTLEVPSLQNAQVYLPIPPTPHFIKKLKITEGRGSFNIKQTKQGAALEIRFTGKITIQGRLQYANDSFYYTPGLSLTDVEKLNQRFRYYNQSDSLPGLPKSPEDKYSRKLNLRRYLRMYARNLSVPKNTPQINFKFSHIHWRGSDTVKFEGKLSSGWETYKTELSDVRM